MGWAGDAMNQNHTQGGAPASKGIAGREPDSLQCRLKLGLPFGPRHMNRPRELGMRDGSQPLPSQTCRCLSLDLRGWGTGLGIVLALSAAIFHIL